MEGTSFMYRKTCLVILSIFCFSLTCYSQAMFENPQQYAENENLNAVLWMQHSGEYKALCYQAYNIAKIMLDQALKDKNWCAELVQQAKGGYQDLKPAIVLDVDETVLDNTFYQGDLMRKRIAYSGATWDLWCRDKKAIAIAGAAEFCRYAADKGVTVFYVTNRKQNVEEVTAQNLAAEGFPLKKEERTVLARGEGRGKGERRAMIAQKYRIVLLFGDNNCDFADDFNEKTTQERNSVTQKYASHWGTKWIILPNPAYGDWENALLQYNYRWKENERLKMKYDHLRK